MGLPGSGAFVRRYSDHVSLDGDRSSSGLGDAATFFVRFSAYMRLPE